MARLLQGLLLIAIATFLLSLSGETTAAQDPVARFIASADSLLRTGGGEALSSLVASNTVLVAAAVGRLLEAAIETGDGGDKAAERESFALAQKLSQLYRAQTGSRGPLDCIAVYRAWRPKQRSIRREAKKLEGEASSAQGAGNPDAAVALYHQALALYETIGDKHSIAVTWGSLGVANWTRNDMKAVKECYEKALAARRDVEDRILEGKTLNGLGSLHFVTGDYETAASYYRSAIDLRRSTGDVSGLGVSLTYLGNSLGRLGRLGEAGDAYREALAVLGASGTPGQMVDALNGIASVYSGMSRFALSDGAYRTAIRVCAASSDPLKEAPCRLNLADNLRLEGRYREAMGVLDTLRMLLDTHPDRLYTAEYHNNLGLTYLAMDELDLARENLLAMLHESDSLDDPLYSMEALINLGWLYNHVGANEEGLSCAEKASARAEDAGNQRLLREARELVAIFEWKLGRYSEAREHWRWALERDIADGFRDRELLDRMNLATVAASLGQTEEARRQFVDVRPLVLASGRKNDLAWAVEFGIGHTYDRENPDSAYWHYERAIDLIERSRTTIGGAELQSGFLSGERRRFFEEVARYCVSQEDGSKKGGVWSERAFSTIEKGKARGLLDLLERSIGTQDSPEESAVLDSLYHLNKASAGYADEMGRLRNRYLELRDGRIERTAGTLGLGRGTASVGMVRQALDRGTAVLEYALGDTTSFVFVIDRDGHEVHPVPDRAALRLEVERLRDALAKPGAADAVMLEEASNLYERLLGPVEKRLSKSRRLVVIPDGVLFELPFDMLLTERPKAGEALRKQPFLTRRWSTVYAPSASVFLALCGRPEGSGHDLDLAAMGDPDFSRIAGDDGAKLTPLPNSRAEVEGIGSRVKAARKLVRVGDQASEAAFKALVREHSTRIIHLATHGIVDPVEPMRSCVVLSPSDDPREDGSLYMLEIFGLPVRADLVVLSACESAAGTVSRGEGVVGLSRAFIGSGAGGVVASLWAVSDLSTAELMQRFYDSLFDGDRPAGEALRRARASLIDDPRFSHPFYWSPFIVIGTERTPW
jgi:CHAT domain-containing protein